MSLSHALKRRLRQSLMCSVMAGALMFAASPSFAQSASQMDRLESQIQQLQQQLQGMREQVTTTQQQVQKSQDDMKKVQSDVSNVPKVTFANGRPGWVSADGQNSVQLTGRLHFDIGDYLSVSRPGSNQSLQDGANARRARIGILGKVMGDWNYALVADFGGSSDTTNTANSGATNSQIENAYITYNGFRPVAVDFGYLDVPWTLDEATSSNDIMFMERSSSQVVATAFGAGDARSALGIRSNDDRYWAGFYVTGPAAGASHSGSSMSQLAELGRFAYQVYQDADSSVHLGLNGAYVSHANGGSTTTMHQLTLSDRPELRIDPTSFLTTGALNTDSAWVGGVEAAAAYQNFFAQGEYFHYSVDQFATSSAPAPTLDFDGGYMQASYSFGGRRKYNPGNGAYTGVIPDHPMDSSFKSWGALELAGRYSVTDLNDNVTNGVSQSTTGGVFGGKQQTYAVGLNWYPNTNIRFMLDYLHTDVDKLASNGVTPANAHIDAVAARAQFAF
jgi:phosphate-selective porin OprO/OprP